MNCANLLMWCVFCAFVATRGSAALKCYVCDNCPDDEELLDLYQCEDDSGGNAPTRTTTKRPPGGDGGEVDEYVYEYEDEDDIAQRPVRTTRTTTRSTPTRTTTAALATTATTTTSGAAVTFSNVLTSNSGATFAPPMGGSGGGGGGGDGGVNLNQSQSAPGSNGSAVNGSVGPGGLGLAGNMTLSQNGSVGAAIADFANNTLANANNTLNNLTAGLQAQLPPRPLPEGQFNGSAALPATGNATNTNANRNQTLSAASPTGNSSSGSGSVEEGAAGPFGGGGISGAGPSLPGINTSGPALPGANGTGPVLPGAATPTTKPTATTSKGKEDEDSADYSDYSEEDDRHRGVPKATARSGRQAPRQAACYLLQLKVNKTIVVKRGCTKMINANNYLTCQSLHAGKPAEECQLCGTDGCNQFLSDYNDWNAGGGNAGGGSGAGGGGSMGGGWSSAATSWRAAQPLLWALFVFMLAIGV